MVRLKCDGAELRAASRVELVWVRVRVVAWQGINDQIEIIPPCSNINHQKPSINMLANRIHEGPIQSKRYIQTGKPHR